MGAATSDGSLFQSTPGTSTYSSISLPSGSVMYRLCVTVWSLAPTTLTALASSGGQGLAQLVVAVADLQAEVVQADPAARREVGRVLADLDEQQLVVGAPGRREKAAARKGVGPSSGPPRIWRQPSTSR